MFILIIEFILLYLIIIFVISFMLDEGCNHHEGINNGLPRGMKCYPTQFMQFPYYEDLKIAHVFYTMHIGNNVNETLWRIIDGRRDKDFFFKICIDIQEAIHAMRSVIRYSNRLDGVLDRNNLPWLLTEQQSNSVKEVIQRIKFPMGFASIIKNILTKKGEFGGVKTHDWHTFIKVIILVYIFIYIGLIHLLFIFIFCCLLWSKQITIHFVVTICSTTISPKRL
jgi:hypothetical protein